ncbi:MAG: trigger factor [Sphingobacteriales bacterium]|nr:MAG: trigger factor [Sphingobacteriales bacterium]TAF78726.1 MAG: trigger factor [Sphingobacteriales bacterium]
MRITRNNIDDLNAVISVVIKPDDYQEAVEKALKVQAKKTKLPGYRPGTVPMAQIKRMYGKNLLLEEINKLLSDAVNNYIKQNEIEILGQPLPINDGNPYKWEIGEEFTFDYEIGLAPIVVTEFNASDSLINYEIKVDEETLASRIKNLRRSYGKMTQPEISMDGDVLLAEFTQLNTDGRVLENGLHLSSTLRLDIIAEAYKNQLINLKREDIIPSFDLVAAVADEVQLRKILKLDDANAIIPQSNFKITVKNINRLEESDLDINFYNKVFGEDAGVSTEDEFKTKITTELEAMMAQDADRKLAADFYKHGETKLNLKLPDDFLKRWLKTVNKDVSDEDLEKGYAEFATNLKWTLVENKIIADNKISINYQDVFSAAKQRLDAQFRMYSPTPIAEEQLAEYATQYLKESANASQVFNEVKSAKVFEHLKTVITLNKKQIDFKEFQKLG